jgi:hypothetical protein
MAGETLPPNEPGKKPMSIPDLLSGLPPGGGPGNGNGNNAQTVRWVIGILGGALIALVGGMLTTLNSDSAKISGLESRMDALEHQFEKIDAKLDRLIDKQNGGKQP